MHFFARIVQWLNLWFDLSFNINKYLYLVVSHIYTTIAQHNENQSFIN